MHSHVGFKAVAIAKLTRQEKLQDQEGLMVLTRKKSGKTKGQLAYNGKYTGNWITKEDKSSPSVRT